MKAMLKSAPTGKPPPEPACLVRAVAASLDEEPALEAVRIDRGHRAVSVATLGRPDNAEIERVVGSRIERLQEEPDAENCALLSGGSSCEQCPTHYGEELGRRLTVKHDAQATTIARVTCPTAPRFWRWRSFPLPKLVPREFHLPDEEDHEREWKPQLAAALVCGAAALLAHLLAPRNGPLGLALFGVAYLAGSWFTIQEVLERLRQRVLDVHFLMLAVAAGSAAIGEWDEGAILLFLFSISGALEHYALGRTSREIRSLFKEAPKTALVLDEHGAEQRVAVDELRPGQRLLVKPGEQFPVDAEVVKGGTASDESNLTGEAAPVDKRVGDTVFAGTLNLWGAVETVVLRPAAQSALHRIIDLIKRAQHLKAPSQRFTDRFSTTYTYAILGLTLLMFFVWWLVLGKPAFVSGPDARSAFYHAMTLLVVASPCALVLSIPSAVLAAIAWAARRGILFRGGAAVENLAEVTVVAMDKTGTLTTGELRVERVESFPPGREREVAELAYSLERLSTHPLARAITRHGKQQSLPAAELERVESVTGLGLQALHRGHRVRLGRRDWVEDQGATPAGAAVTEPGSSEVWLATDGLAGRLVLRDDVRPQARDVVLRLREMGLQTVVLTGDRRAAAETLRSQLALDDVRAELKPDQKVEAITSFTREGRRVAMIGDGVNDAPSLAAADVGVAMGARGSDAALEQAEVILMHDRLENFLTAYQLSRRARAIIRQNLILSLGTVVVLAAGALTGSLPLTAGVIGHEGSTVIVVMNSLRLLWGRSR